MGKRCKGCRWDTQSGICKITGKEEKGVGCRSNTLIIDEPICAICAYASNPEYNIIFCSMQEASFHLYHTCCYFLDYRD